MRVAAALAEVVVLVDHRQRLGLASQMYLASFGNELAWPNAVRNT
jgi:hypothetical protein